MRAHSSHLGHFLLRRSAGRLVLAVALGVLVDQLVATRAGWAISLIAGWDAGALLMLLISWGIIARSSPASTRARAGTEDPGRTAVWAIVSIASVIGFFASAVVLRSAKGIAPYESRALITLALAAVAMAWFLTHSSFTLRYARLYYRPKDGEGGIEFPGGEAPDDFDFAYFAFTIGMTFQVSDAVVTNRSIRRTVLVHALLAFAYNTAILALALNVFFNLLG